MNNSSTRFGPIDVKAGSLHLSIKKPSLILERHYIVSGLKLYHLGILQLSWMLHRQNNQLEHMLNRKIGINTNPLEDALPNHTWSKNFYENRATMLFFFILVYNNSLLWSVFLLSLTWFCRNWFPLNYHLTMPICLQLAMCEIVAVFPIFWK